MTSPTWIFRVIEYYNSIIWNRHFLLPPAIKKHLTQFLFLSQSNFICCTFCPVLLLFCQEMRKQNIFARRGRVLLVRCLLKTWSGLLIYFLMYNIRFQCEFLNTLYICFTDGPRLQNEMRGEVDKNFKN